MEQFYVYFLIIKCTILSQYCDIYTTPTRHQIGGFNLFLKPVQLWTTAILFLVFKKFFKRGISSIKLWILSSSVIPNS